MKRLLLLLLLSVAAQAQFSRINSIDYQQSGTEKAFITYPHTLNFIGCVVTPSGSTIAIDCTSAGGGANPGGSPKQVQFQVDATHFGGISGDDLGKVLIGQGGGNQSIFADPIVQLTQAPAST